jgi:hypothetical protein
MMMMMMMMVCRTFVSSDNQGRLRPQDATGNVTPSVPTTAS